MKTRLLFALLLICQSALAADYDYPELQVTPLASQRLMIEGNKEGTFNMGPFLPYQISALSTFTAGLIQSSNVDPSKDSEERSPMVGMLVGGGWLALGTAMARYYHPYQNGLSDIKSLPASSKKEQLVRERLAEEAINDAERLGNRLMWISFASNAGASAYMLSNAKKKSSAIPASAIGILTSFAPILFKHPWQRVAKEQREYKKKIYGPISMNNILIDPNTNKIYYGALFTYQF